MVGVGRVTCCRSKCYSATTCSVLILLLAVGTVKELAKLTLAASES